MRKCHGSADLNRHSIPPAPRQRGERVALCRQGCRRAVRFASFDCPPDYRLGALLSRQGAESSPYGLRAAPTP